jgi:hypothetical protein
MDLILAPGGSRAAQLAKQLQSETSLRIGTLDLADIVDGESLATTQLSTDCLLAIGAALRVETTAL